MKPVSAIIRESIDPACGQAGEALADHAQDYEAWLEVQLEAERAAGEERYQEGLIAEARAIVAGTSNAHPQATHLWTVLDRLDRYAHRRRSHAPHPQGRVRRLLARADLSRPTQTGHPTSPPPSAPQRRQQNAKRGLCRPRLWDRDGRGPPNAGHGRRAGALPRRAGGPRGAEAGVRQLTHSGPGTAHPWSHTTHKRRARRQP